MCVGVCGGVWVGRWIGWYSEQCICDYELPLLQVFSRPPPFKREAVSPQPSYDLDDGDDMEWADEDGPVKQREGDDCTDSVTCESVTSVKDVEDVKEEDVGRIGEETENKPSVYM